MTTTAQRLDKWLWFTRLIKTRSQASKLVVAGKVRINKVKATKPSVNVREGDVITAIIHQRLRVVKVLAPGSRRGPAVEAQELYEDLTPDEDRTSLKKADSYDKAMGKPVPVAPAPKRDKGTGRPTKRDRRKMTAFQEASRKEQ